MRQGSQLDSLEYDLTTTTNAHGAFEIIYSGEYYKISKFRDIRQIVPGRRGVSDARYTKYMMSRDLSLWRFIQCFAV